VNSEEIVLHVPAAITPEKTQDHNNQIRAVKAKEMRPGARNALLENAHVIFQNFAVNTVS
jgi:hypothetical protein